MIVFIMSSLSYDINQRLYCNLNRLYSRKKGIGETVDN